jgi:curli biogenesis system outer membrane secretion channel CsgG
MNWKASESCSVRLTIGAGVFACVFLITAPSAADYVAYSKGKNGQAPLPEYIDDIDSRYLVNLEWGDYTGRQSRLAVMEVDNTSTAPSYYITAMGDSASYSGGGQVPVNGIEAILTDVLHSTGRFRMIERQQLDNVLKEQDLATSGRVSGASGTSSGNVLGAEYLVQMVVNSYETKTSGTNKGLGGFLRKSVPVVGGVDVQNSSGSVNLNFRLIDAETSEVIYTKQITSEVKESGVSVGGGGVIDDLGLGGFFDEYSKTPIGQAVIAGVNKGVYELVKEIGVSAAEGAVVQSKDGKVWVNLGAGSVEVGDRLVVERQGEALIDPDTGMNLGSTSTPVGELEVSQVEEQFSIATIIRSSSEPARGDRVGSTAPVSGMEFASRFDAPGK